MDTYDKSRTNLPSRLNSRQSALPATRPASGQSESVPSPLSIRMLLRGARRYWWLILALWVVGSTGAGGLIYMSVRPTYRATSLLRVSPSETDLYNLRGHGETLDTFLNTQVQLITSPNVLQAAGTNPKAAVLPRVQAAGDVVVELRKAVQVSIMPGTYLIEVAMSSPNSQESATIVNAVVDAFIEANTEWSDGMTRAQIKALEVYLSDLKNQSDDLKRKWIEKAQKSEGGPSVIVAQPTAAGSRAPDSKLTALTNVNYEHYKELQQKIFDTTLELNQAMEADSKAKRDAEAVAEAPEGGESSARLSLLVSKKVASDPEVNRLYGDVRAAQERLDDVQRRVRLPGDPAARRASEAYQAAFKKYAVTYEAKKEEYAALAESDPAGGTLSPEREARMAEEKVASLKTRLEVMKKQFDKLKLDNMKTAGDGVEVSLIQEEVRSLQSMQEVVNRRLEQLKFEARGEARIRPVNVAQPPGRPVSDKRVQYLAMTPVAVLGVVLAMIAVLELRSARVADPEHLSSRVRHEVFSIAPLPNLRPGDASDDLKAEQRLARFVQSLDHLRVALCENSVAGEGLCVMITSATGGEGKTTLSAHLAARCANAGTSTLLIDADMRRASLGRLLDVPTGPGLADVLVGEVELDAALVTVQAGGFHFLSAGTPGRDPARVLKSSRLAELLGRLRREYDLVLIDTPPILPVADALIMGRWADGAVVAARYDASRLPLVERANRQLAVAGIPILGVVVNGVRGGDANYGNYAYSYNYHVRPEPPADAPSA